MDNLSRAVVRIVDRLGKRNIESWCYDIDKQDHQRRIFKTSIGSLRFDVVGKREDHLSYELYVSVNLAMKRGLLLHVGRSDPAEERQLVQRLYEWLELKRIGYLTQGEPIDDRVKKDFYSLLD